MVQHRNLFRREAYQRPRHLILLAHDPGALRHFCNAKTVNTAALEGLYKKTMDLHTYRLVGYPNRDSIQ